MKQTDIENKTVVIDVIGEIGWDVTNEELNGAIDTAEQNDEVAEVLVRISSFGGDLQTALTVYDRLRALAADGVKVTTRMSGICASAATVIAMAGDVREMNPYALMLVHRASVSTYGNLREHERNTETLAKIDERLAALYAERTGRTAEDMQKLMDECDGVGKFMTAAEAYGYGFVTADPTAAEESAAAAAAANVGRRLTDAMAERTRLAARLTEQEAQAEQRAKEQSARVAELEAALEQLNAEREAEEQSHAARVQEMQSHIDELEAAMESRPTACDRIDGDSSGWENTERYKQVKQMLGK